MLKKDLTPMSQPSYMEWVEWTKIIGIFLVTLGHGNVVSVEVNTLIYSFHMPLFFFQSIHIIHSFSFSFNLPDYYLF